MHVSGYRFFLLIHVSFFICHNILALLQVRFRSYLSFILHLLVGLDCILTNDFLFIFSHIIKQLKFCVFCAARA